MKNLPRGVEPVTAAKGDHLHVDLEWDDMKAGRVPILLSMQYMCHTFNLTILSLFQCLLMGSESADILTVD